MAITTVTAPRTATTCPRATTVPANRVTYSAGAKNRQGWLKIFCLFIVTKQLYPLPLLFFFSFSVSGQCEPVCAQGCVNGTCVSPGVCQCHFGFVGDNCSSQCSCNKHSNCAGVNNPDVCLQCHNNTIVSASINTHPCTVSKSFSLIYFYVLTSPYLNSRANTARSVSHCLWARPRGAAHVVHVGSSAGETVLCVCLGMNTRRPLKTLGSSLWIPTK